MLNQKDILNLYKKYNVSASKRFGQNFLHDSKILDKIIDSSEVDNQDIVEIGPGLGSLTHALLEKAKSVTSYELDQDMIKVLKGEINTERFNLIEGDFLKQDLNWDGSRIVVANIPYNITTEILFKLFKNNKKIKSATLLLQKEFAERLFAPIGTKNYGKLTITTNLFASVEKIIIVPPESFLPAPKVTSMVVKLTFNDIDYLEKENFLIFIKKCFAMRRKTLFNNLRKFIDESKAKEALEKFNFKSDIRPQALSKEDFFNIFSFINS